MRLNRFEALCSHVLETKIRFDLLVEDFDSPAQSIPYEDLPCFGFQIIAGQELSPATRFFLNSEQISWTFPT